MPRHAFRWLVFPLVAALAACSANGMDTTPLGPIGPAASRATLTFSAAGQTQAIAVTDPGLPISLRHARSGVKPALTRGPVH
jgi:hypothetical protein